MWNEFDDYFVTRHFNLQVKDGKLLWYGRESLRYYDSLKSKPLGGKEVNGEDLLKKLACRLYKDGNVDMVPLNRNALITIEVRVEEMEKGKTTPKGEYPKLADDKHCAFPERADCNNGNCYNRCDYMTYGGRPGNWFCSFSKE
jgi:hypothetical protein